MVVIERPDGYGKVRNPVRSDLMEIFVNFKDTLDEDPDTAGRRFVKDALGFKIE